ncbi:MAG: type I restriction-modification system subunit M [Thermoguttaceae bacterium]|nr:type I restriction-modification system subunit M [Thermoguttaceae bacterium]
MNAKLEREREALRARIWSIADELRGAVDGWDFKNYVLGAMFYRYLSEKLEHYVDCGEREAGNALFPGYAKLSDDQAVGVEEGLIDELGYFVLPSELFRNVVKRASDEGKGQKPVLNETLEKIFKRIVESARGTESEGRFVGLFDDFNANSAKLGSSLKLRNERLVKLLEGVAKMELNSPDDPHLDIDDFGDAYEYLMAMYASNAGKSGGEFFTPADVSVLLSRLGTIGRKSVNKVYDPACGSGSLLLKSLQVLGKNGVKDGFWGQEINLTTYNLCRINMFVHNVPFDRFHIECDDTLVSPKFLEEGSRGAFDLIVSNPPYSIKWEGDGNELLINDARYAPAGALAPQGNADLAFVMHSLYYLAPKGSAAIVCFPGIMYRGGAEGKIRQYLVDQGFVDAVLLLPDNLFFGTSIATCVLVLRKGRKKGDGVLFIDATNECVKITNNNKLTPENIDRIVQTATDRVDVEGFARLVSIDEIRKNDYNLSVTSYVQAESEEDGVDIRALNREIEEIVERQRKLRESIDAIIADIEGNGNPGKTSRAR